MRIIKEILGRIFALWAMLIFCITLLLIFFPVWFISLTSKDPIRIKRIYFFYCLWIGMFFPLSGVRRKFIGRENFKKGETYVVVSNHRSLLDPPISVPAIPAPSKTIAKIEMARIPIFNVIYKTGSVLVDRKSEESRRRSYSQMKEVLTMGLHMCIYPEGTRNKTKEPLLRFQDGAFKLAVETGKPVIPALIFNSDKVLPRKIFFYWPHKLEMHFLPAVASTNKTAKQLKDEVFEIMKAYYLQHQ